MNQHVRLLLIEAARRGQTVKYSSVMEQLGLQPGQSEDHKELSTVLAEISEYEVSQRRPMLSAIATYSEDWYRKNNLKDWHGGGFYEVATKLGFGGDLKRNLFAEQEMRRVQDYWADVGHYRQFARASQGLKAPSFFSVNDLQFLKTWAGQVYDKADPIHIAAKNYIMQSVGEKTVYWSKELVKQLPGFNTFNWRMWSYPAWITDSDSRKKQVAKFKGYSWARIYRADHDNYDIFFNIGVSTEKMAITFQLDFYFESDSHLSQEQKSRSTEFLKAIPLISIPATSLVDYDWPRLIKESGDFIQKHVPNYDNLVELIWGKNKPTIAFTDLRLNPPPAAGYTELPPENPKFQPVDVDYIQDAVDRKETGDGGEELVLRYERHRLSAWPELAAAIEPAKDGEGFDIKSFNENGKPIFIEVKTTTGGPLQPFEYTSNEHLFAKANPGNYWIYRLYNFNIETRTADFFIVEKPLDQMLLRPTRYRVYLKKL